MSLGGKWGWELDVKLSVSLVSQMTWADDAVRTKPHVLKHEQGHFDIAGLLARDAATRLLNLQIDDAELKTRINNIFARTSTDLQDRFRQMHTTAHIKVDQIMRRMYALQDILANDRVTSADGIYDRDTEHGTDRKEQQLWNDVITQAKGIPTRTFERILLDNNLLTVQDLPR
jgi:hypothetical protein